MVVKNLIAALRTEESVYVNDLGLFQKRFIASQMEKGVLIPPRYFVELDAMAEGSGFAFTLYVSQHELMKIVDADRMVREWVQQLLSELKQQKRVEVAGLGTFTLKKNGTPIFASDFIAALNEEYDGMSPIPVQKINKKQYSLAALVGKEETPIEPQYAPEPTMEAPVVEESAAPVIETPIEPQYALEPTMEEPVVEESAAPVIETPMEPQYAPEPPVEEPIVEESAEPAIETPIEQQYAPEPTAEEPVVEDSAEPVIETPIEPQYAPEPPAEEPVVEDSAEPAIETPIEPQYAPEPTMEESVVEESEDSTIDPSTMENERQETRTSWIWVIIIMILLVVGFMLWKHFYQPQSSCPDAETVPQEECVDTDSLVDTATIVVDTNGLEVVDTTAKESLLEVWDIPSPCGGILMDEPADVEVEAQPFDLNNLQRVEFESGKFYVIHGSFYKEKDCIRHIVNRDFVRYEPVLLHQASDPKRLRVCLGVFSSEREAERCAASINGAWVLKN